MRPFLDQGGMAWRLLRTPHSQPRMEQAMRVIFLWLLGVPISVLVVMLLFGLL